MTADIDITAVPIASPARHSARRPRRGPPIWGPAAAFAVLTMIAAAGGRPVPYAGTAVLAYRRLVLPRMAVSHAGMAQLGRLAVAGSCVWAASAHLGVAHAMADVAFLIGRPAYAALRRLRPIQLLLAPDARRVPEREGSHDLGHHD